MKRLYDLILSERIQNATPSMAFSELEMLQGSIDKDGVLNPLVVWKGRNVLVDGYYRYMYCHEKGIPFDIVEKEFVDETEAVLWVVRQQLARRNLTPFQKCEMVLPLEAEIAAEAKKRILAGKKLGGPSISTQQMLADMAGISTGTLRYAKYILQNGDKETLRRVRTGELSIYGAYRSLVQGMGPATEATTELESVSADTTTAKPDLQPIKDAIENLISRVNNGDASPKDIVVELSRVAKLINDVGA